MFKLFKEKLKSVFSRFKKDIDEKTEQEISALKEKEELTEKKEELDRKKLKEKLAEEKKKEKERLKEEREKEKELKKLEKEKAKLQKRLMKEKHEEQSEKGKKLEEVHQLEKKIEEIKEEKKQLEKEHENQEKGLKKEKSADDAEKASILEDLRDLKEEIAIIERKEERLEEKEAETEQKEEKEKKSIFTLIKEKFTSTKLSEEDFEKFFEQLELTLLENNVAISIIDRIRAKLKEKLINNTIKKSEIDGEIKKVLKGILSEILINPFDIVKKINEKKEKPFVIVFFGINGGGKTTTIAKIANLLQKNRLKCVFAASDTFRAASIEQLEKHAANLGVNVIKHQYGADPAAVAFDAIQHAKAAGKDVVLIDTAGRMHTKTDLMREMEKIVRVSKPDLKIFVGESITGNDAVEQASAFNKSVGIDGIILTKADVDEKGGAMISVSEITKKPILFLGTGQGMEDLIPFKKEDIIENLGLE